jgi:hypothetical protein
MQPQAPEQRDKPGVHHSNRKLRENSEVMKGTGNKPVETNMAEASA